jgi:hypothetical protein
VYGRVIGIVGAIGARIWACRIRIDECVETPEPWRGFATGRSATMVP